MNHLFPFAVPREPGLPVSVQQFVFRSQRFRNISIRASKLLFDSVSRPKRQNENQIDTEFCPSHLLNNKNNSIDIVSRICFRFQSQ